MMSCFRAPIVALSLLLIVGLPSAAGTSMRLNANPIRRVVSMLQMMQKKIEAEGKTEQELFDKFMCFCKGGVGKLVDSISGAEEKVAQLGSTIEETDSQTKQLTSDIAKAKADRTEAKATLGKAKAIREKENTDFTKLAADAKTNIGGMTKALAALAKGAGGSFLQTSAAANLKRLSITMDISEADRDVLASFLTAKNTNQDDSEDFAPASGEIIGILKQMQETMTKALGESTAAEEDAATQYAALADAKQRQVNTLTKEIESKMMRSGEKGVALTIQKEDLDDTSSNLVKDKKFLIDVTKNCQTKQAEKESNDKMRADEMLALADTIKILNDDDALDLFKKTLPGAAAFMQVSSTSKQLKQKALQVLKRHRGKHDVRLNLISLALRGKKVSFDKVVKMIDDMANLLKKEQGSDDKKKAFCLKQKDETQDSLDGLQLDIKDLNKAIAEKQEGIKALAAEILSLRNTVIDTDKQVASSTAQRKEENSNFKETEASDAAATELIGMAKNRLAKFYSPSTYKAAPKRQLSEADQIAVNMGGTAPPTAAPGGIAGTGVTAAFAQYQTEVEDEGSLGFLQVRRVQKAAPPPPPATAGAYKKSGDSSSGIMAMLDIMVADLQKGMTENSVNEKEAQREYEEFMEDSQSKRAAASKSISDKEGAKVEMEAQTLKMEGDRKGKTAESMAKIEELQGLAQECDWLVKNYDTRKTARASEGENLLNAKAVLNGADYSF